MPPSADPSVQQIIDQTRQDYPGVPFLALGQTAFWDEPTKAVWRSLLDRLAPDQAMIAGVHDTDYFAKTAAHLDDDQKYVALPHDDGRTRDLWSAAGELSSLFGSESVPTRHMFLSRGVPFDWLSQTYPGGKDALFTDKTTAWGWRGIVSTQSHSVIAHDVPVLEIKDALLAQLDWGFAESLACLEDVDARAQARDVTATIRGWVTDFLENCQEDCRLSDLYQTLLPRLYSLLLNHPPAQFQTTTSTELFRFNSQTCRRPRFALLQAFLAPATRQAAREAYNRSVGGSGIYTLEGFGTGAIPFDVVIPGHGRGTLCLLSDRIVIETAPQKTMLPGPRITTAEELAARLEEAFGPDVVLAGKAVTLVDMIAAEYLVVFHETASGYTPATQQFNSRLAAAGITIPLYPLVRLTYPTWDALETVPDKTRFRLPPHLATTFGRETISAPEFGRGWRSVVAAQRQVLQEVNALTKTRELMGYLEGKDQLCWCDKSDEYERALSVLRDIAAKSETMGSRIQEHRDERRTWRNERQGLERRSGDDWRHSVEPLREKIRLHQAEGDDVSSLERDLRRQIALRAEVFEEKIELCRERIQATDYLLSEFRRQRRLLERSPEAQSARETIRRITWEAQLARLDLVRNAYLTVEGLEHTDLRPTAWWLPLVSPDGAWLEAIISGTKARFESLAPGA
jgi:hypothetical protein